MMNLEPEADKNQIISSLWIGRHLSLLELLTIQSFLRQGHRFKLYVYQELLTPVPEGCEILDANSILPKEAIFRYKNASQFGQGKGSVSGFSDIFRYKLLYETGGWWVDMDVTCLKKFDFSEEYFFRNHHELNVVGNVMKCPPKSELMKRCFEQAIAQVNEENLDWHLPIKILNDNISNLHLSNHIHLNVSNDDRWEKVKEFLLQDINLPSNFYCIHWMNENWRSKGLDKNDFKISSVLGRLLIDNGLIVNNFNKWNLLKNHFRFKYLKGL